MNRGKWIIFARTADESGHAKPYDSGLRLDLPEPLHWRGNRPAENARRLAGQPQKFYVVRVAQRLAPWANGGGLLFGIAALIWTFDCFVGFYLTLPRPLPETASQESRSWWSRWWPSWKFFWRGKPYRINFSLHRAVGLWIWPLLLIFAISTVSFNLPQVYLPIMKKFFHMPDVAGDLPNLPAPIPDPALSWREAAAIGQKLAAEQAKLHGFKLWQGEDTPISSMTR